jgi:hypothetical protein
MLSGIERRTRRQIVLTTHSKDLLDDAEIDAGGLLLLVPGEEETKVASGSLPDACALLDGCYPEAAQETSRLDENQLELFPSETPVG